MWYLRFRVYVKGLEFRTRNSLCDKLKSVGGLVADPAVEQALGPRA